MDTLQLVINELKKELKGFEVRDEQMEMMRTVYDSMVHDKKTAVHAPTGTGKSLGYLIPGLAAKIDNPQFKMTISTFTISLQEQLLKDLELAKKIYRRLTDKRLRFVVLKGKNNYFCEKSYNDAVSGDEIPASLISKVDSKISSLKLKNKNLDRQTLGVKMNGNQWELMTPDNCLGEQCPMNAACTFYDHHMKLSSSDIVVVNHSLFFARHFFLTDAWNEFSFTVFDEAHKLESVILNSQTFDISSDQVRKWVFQGSNLAKKFKVSDSMIDEFVQKFLLQNDTAKEFYEYSLRYGAIVTDETMSFHKTGQSEDDFKELMHKIASWQKEMYTFYVKEIVTDEFKQRKDFPEFKEQFKFWVSSLMGFQEFTRSYFSKENPGVLWSEKNKRGEVTFKVTPRSIQDIQNPFPKPLLLTSGTLAVQESCRPFAERIQIELDSDLVLPTPFDLKNQSLVYVSQTANPKDIKNYQSQLEDEILRLLQLGKRKTFVLFTAKKQMEMAYKNLKPQIQKFSRELGEDLDVWLQDDSNGNDIMSSFNSKDKKSILFGTLRYFEGIDLKEESLTQLILTKLPYSRPDHPIQEILDQNSNYSKWEAVIKFEQAFGRLIRTSKDYGTFSLIDNRSLQPFFRDFLDVFRHEGVPITQNMDDIQAFYESKKDR